MIPNPRTAVVTGANKGIGYAIVRNIALGYPTSPFHNLGDDGPLLIYLTARSPDRGAEAVRKLNEDAALKKAGVLVKDGGNTTIKFHELDIDDQRSIDAFGEFLVREHQEGIDIAVNNAGIALDGFNEDVVKRTLKTNYSGTLHATRMFLDCMRPGSCLVNVASAGGKLDRYSTELREAFHEASRTSVEACTALMERYKADVKDGRQREEGWPSTAYGVSKAGVIAMTLAISNERENDGSGGGIFINVCCPGYVNTDMSKGNGTKTIDEGAVTPVMLALGNFDAEKTANFWIDGRVVEW